MSDTVTVIGAGLAGCEAAWQMANRGISVELVEMKPEKKTPAHVSDAFAELVCSNSLRSDELHNAAGLLKAELRRLDSLIMASADANRVAAGGALAVDRVGYANMVTERILAHPNIRVIHREAVEIPEGKVIVASGPLTSDGLSQSIAELCPESSLYFFDAAAPIVSRDSIDFSSAFYASRYGKGSDDYINCPLAEEEYQVFWQALCSAEQAPVHGFEDQNVFEGCMPVEVMARRGKDTLRYGPMKPVGLKDPKTGLEPYAVVQLRAENQEGTLFNLVGFQTHLRFGEQRRVFSIIPALAEAEYVRYGKMHRNTYLDSPKLLDKYYRLKQQPRIRFAGQMTGVEGYVESCASGMLVGIETARETLGLPPADFPRETAIGALAAYVSEGAASGNFQPMNINFGILPPLSHRIRGKRERNEALSYRALEIIDHMKEKGI